MEHDRRDEHAAGDEPRDQLGRERPAGARHLGAAGLERVDVLVRLERPRRAARSRSGSGCPCRRGTPRAARAGRAARARAARRRRTARGARDRAAGQREALADGAAANGGARRRAELDDPDGRRRWPGAGVESRSSSASPSPRVAGSAAGSVAEVLTTSRSPGARKRGRSRKRACTMAPSCARRRPAARTSSRREPARLGRLVRLEARRQLERERAHADDLRPARARGSGRSAARPRSARAGPGTLSSGGGRSEMSSPGNASCCICVRMSPGSTA